MKKIKILIAVIFVFSLSSMTAVYGQLTNLGYVVVSPNGPSDNSDFGPFTPGTQTAGIQEAFDFAKDNLHEVYIVGGGANGFDGPVIYNLNTTLTIPWGQDWHCDGGNYILNFTQTSGDCFVIESQMSCRFKFGSVHAPNLLTGSVVKFNPTVVGPDNFNVFETSIFEFGSIRGGGDPAGGVPGKGVGLHLLADSTPHGNISDCEFFVREIVACETGLLLEGNRGLNNHKIQCGTIHNCNNGIVVNSSFGNQIRGAVDPDGVGGTAIGVQFNGGSQNTCFLTWQGTAYDPGLALQLTGSATDNLIFASNLEPAGITNTASNPSNRIISTQAIGFGISTPLIPVSNNDQVNNTPYAVVITMIDAGNVSSWRITDNDGTSNTVNAPLLAGQSIYLEPGEAIRMTYTTQPSWVWRALR